MSSSINIANSDIIVTHKQIIPDINATYKNNSLYINSKGIRNTIGGATQNNKIEYIYNLINKKLIFTDAGTPQYYFKNFLTHTFYTIFINSEKINDYIMRHDNSETIETIYLVNNENRYVSKSPCPDLSDFTLNYKFNLINKKIVIPDSIVYTNTD